MISKQMIVGDSTEEKIAKYFQSKGYWAYILPKKIGGQPFDIIACRGKDTWFIDAKHLEEKKASFDFERIEPNQKTSMQYAKSFAKMQNMGFIIVWDREPNMLYYLPYDKYREYERQGKKSIKMGEISSEYFNQE